MTVFFIVSALKLFLFPLYPFFFFFLTQNSGERGGMALPCPGRPSASGVTGPVLGKHIQTMQHIGIIKAFCLTVALVKFSSAWGQRKVLGCCMLGESVPRLTLMPLPFPYSILLYCYTTSPTLLKMHVGLSTEYMTRINLLHHKIYISKLQSKHT